MDEELTRDCETILIDDAITNLDVYNYLLELIVINQKCTQRFKAIREINTND